MLIKIRLFVIVLVSCFSVPAFAQWQLTGNRDATTTSQIGTTNGVSLRLSTKNLPRMVIDTTGNVGIGTLTPGYPLHVAGKVKIADGTQAAGKVLTSDANGLASWLTPTVSPWTVSGNNIYSINTGFVGIGTATPLYKLDVTGDIRVNGLKIGKGKNSIVDNTVLGIASLDSNTTGTGNTANGYNALNLNTTGSKNTAIGSNALSKNTTASENTATGAGALQKNTIGRNNTAMGANTLNANTTGVNNIATGDSALFANTIGNGNTAIGMATLKGTTTGNTNSAFGYKTLLTNTTGSSNTAIGYGADVLGTAYTNATAIGANAKVGQNNSLVLGSGANVGIGTSTPAAKLDVVGTIKISDGTQASGKVLTCNGAGLGSWQIAPGSLWTLSGGNAYYSQAGNIGIGTTIPANKLSVTGNVDVNGKVGIGTTSPGTKLQVGTKVIDDNNFTYDSNALMVVHPTPTSSAGLNDPKTTLLLARQGTNGQSYGAAAAFNLSRYENTDAGSKTRLDIRLANGDFLNAANDVMTLQSNGNVGVGTTAPRQKLDINGNLQFSNADLPKSFMDEVGGTSPLFTMGLNFHESNINTAYRGAAYRIDSRNGFPLHNWFSRPANSGTENVIMALAENGGLSVGSTFASSYAAPDNGAIFQGNVGIGKNNPNYKLHVAGDILADGGYVRISGNNGLHWEDHGGGFYMNDNDWIRTDNDKNIWAGNGLLGSSGGLTVGYGGAAPSYGGASIAGYTIIGGGASISGGYVTLCNSLDNTQGNVSIGSGGYNNVKLRVNTDEDFGIFVDGGACAKPGGGSWAVTSDKRLKKDVRPYSDGLSALLKIKPVTYHYNEISGFDMTKEYVGVLAQELQEVAPYMVSSMGFRNTGKEYYSVDNSAMTYMLINSVKELKGQVDTKDETINKQQQQIDRLQNQMNLLFQKFDALDSRQQACCTAAGSQSKITTGQQSTNLSSASLDQNVPNPPVNNATRIGYNIPKDAGKAELVFNDIYGRKIKSVNLSLMGKGILNVDTRELGTGTYSYTLLVDGKMIETKKMVVGK